MQYYIRYTEHAEEDVAHGHSYHLADGPGPGLKYNRFLKAYAERLPGLCAYALEADNVQDAIEEAATHSYYPVFSAESDSYCVLQGEYVGDCPEGDIMRPLQILFVKKY